uniref:Uncharacterized protein n=1 Tax=Nelumbo nucifera TaxID=4432 RepID=A0A822ZGF7_NELNU|nr:TPA_asm: hypothetical protein HUJ06_000981 [Nelumbo nucifera]
MSELVGAWMTKLVSKVQPQKCSHSSVIEQEAKPTSSSSSSSLSSSSSSFIDYLSSPVRAEPAFDGTALSEATVRMLMDRFMPC